MLRVPCRLRRAPRPPRRRSGRPGLDAPAGHAVGYAFRPLSGPMHRPMADRKAKARKALERIGTR
ncbi:hypothetical protein RMHFA_04201 [Roseomonas mucosa]|uniref:Uncharacterized protein n=1 Tax=Roseomonas mucosa TaxID=207340 RepID=A0A4Y1MTV7_9PROT|nr:hypothetical protein RADP37_04201 [Roseomonas mucosa]QDD93618.1 hypothetical protein HVIM_04201 [Roseomonas mucosa]QDD98722.1 hypothetical protein ADP8_04201 [Roseomonas mucosa]UZO95751.1 hypothetical protein RMHFA_04201 [Roseomonas mucosa]